MGPNGPCAGRAGCFGQKSGRKWLFHVVRFGTLWHHGVASRAAREDELEPRGVGLPCVCLPVDTCLRGSSDRRFDPHSSPMCTHSGLASECPLVETSARRIVELSHCRSVNVSKGLRACVLPCVLRSLHCGQAGLLRQLMSAGCFGDRTGTGTISTSSVSFRCRGEPGLEGGQT